MRVTHEFVCALQDGNVIPELQIEQAAIQCTSEVSIMDDSCMLRNASLFYVRMRIDSFAANYIAVTSVFLYLMCMLTIANLMLTTLSHQTL